MKNTRIILSVLFLLVGAGSLVSLASANAGGSNMLGNFLLSGYSYMAYAIPIFYFWFFTLFFVGKQNSKRVIWPVISIFPFILFTLALRVQLWDGFNSTSPLVESVSNFFGKDNAVILLSVMGLLVVITEVLFYGIFLYKKTISRTDTLEETLTDTLEDTLHTIAEQNRMKTKAPRRKFYHPPAMKKSPYMPSTLPKKRPYTESNQQSPEQTPPPAQNNPMSQNIEQPITINIPPQNIAPPVQMQTPPPAQNPVSQNIEPITINIPPQNPILQNIAPPIAPALIQNIVPPAPTPPPIAPSVPAPAHTNSRADEFVMVFNKKKNSGNLGRKISASYTEEDNTMIGLEGYINTESLNHIDLEKEKQDHINQEKINAMDNEATRKTFGEVPVETPIKAPVESAVELPIEAPVESAVEVPIESVVELPIELPIKAPVEAPIEVPIKSPVESVVELPVELAVSYNEAYTEKEKDKEKHTHQKKNQYNR